MKRRPAPQRNVLISSHELIRKMGQVGCCPTGKVQRMTGSAKSVRQRCSKERCKSKNKNMNEQELGLSVFPGVYFENCPGSIDTHTRPSKSIASCLFVWGSLHRPSCRMPSRKVTLITWMDPVGPSASKPSVSQ